MTLACCRRQRHLWQWRRQCVLHQQVCYASHAPRVTCHTSHVVFTRRKSHVTCNTSHVTRHTSHVTGHTLNTTNLSLCACSNGKLVWKYQTQGWHTWPLTLHYTASRVTCHTSRLTSHLMHHLSRITCHTTRLPSHVIHHTSHVTRHTSCITLTRHTSHVIHHTHTSHLTGYVFGSPTLSIPPTTVYAACTPRIALHNTTNFVLHLKLTTPLNNAAGVLCLGCDV